MTQIATPLRSTPYRVDEVTVSDANGTPLFVARRDVAQQIVALVNAGAQSTEQVTK